MTLQFPASPSDGQEYTYNGIIYTWDDTNGVWNAGVIAAGVSYTKAEADAKFVEVTGDAMTGTLSMGNNPIQNLMNPVGDYDAATKFSVKEEAEKKVDKKGDTMTGVLSMSNNAIEDVPAPVNVSDATNKQYVDDADQVLEDSKVDRSGDTMQGNLFLTDGAGDPLTITSPGHAVHKRYVDVEIQNAVSSSITYHGKVDASQSGPLSLPVKLGDFYIHENSDGSGNTVTPDGAWGLNEDIGDLDRLLYNGTDWQILHTSGDYVSKIGGDFMEGPLTIRSQQGDTDPRDNNRINTLGLYSAGTSSLQLGYNNQTKMYVGDTSVSFNNPILVNEIGPRNTSTAINYTGETTDPQHIVSKQVLDDYFDNIIGEFTYKYVGAAETPGFMVDFERSTATSPQNLTWIALCEEDKHGIPLEDDDFYVGQYIHLRTSKGDAYYKVTSALWDAASLLLTNPGWELRLEWIIGDGFKFVQNDEVLIESGNIAALTEIFATNENPEFTGEVTLNEAGIVSNYEENPNDEVVLYRHKPTKVEGNTVGKAKNQLARFVLSNTGGTNTTSIDLEGFTSSNRFKIRGRSNGKEDLIQINADGTIRFYENINLMQGGAGGTVQPRITGLGDPINDGDAVSLGYITEALQEKFEELIGQSSQGVYMHSIDVLPPSGKFSGFDSGSNLLTSGLYDSTKITKLSFHTTDNENHTVDFSGLSIGDYIVLVIDTQIIRYRIENDPVPQVGYAAVDIDVSHISGGGPNTDYYKQASLQFQKISGSVDLTDYVQKSGDTMSGALEFNLSSGNFLMCKNGGSQRFKVDANGKTEINGSLQLNQFINFTGSNNRFIKSGNTDRMEFRTETTGGTVRVTHPGDNRLGFTIKGRITGSLSSQTGDVFNVYHGSGTDADGAYYRGIQSENDNIATMKVVNDKLPLDGSENMTGNLRIVRGDTNNTAAAINLIGSRSDDSSNCAVLSFTNKTTADANSIGYIGYKSTGSGQNGYFDLNKEVLISTSDETKLVLKGTKNNNTDGFATIQFQNTSGGNLDYLVMRGKDLASRYFKLTAPLTIARNRGGDGKENIILEGRVGNSSDTKGKLLGSYTNAASGGGDAVNYYGKVDGSTNIQTKSSVEALIKAGGGMVLEEAGYVAVINASPVYCVLLADPGTKEVSGFYSINSAAGSRNEFPGNWNSELRVGTAALQVRNTDTGNAQVIAEGYDERYTGIVKMVNKDTGGLLYQNNFYRLRREAGKSYCRLYLREDGAQKGAKPTFGGGKYDDANFQNVAVIVEAQRIV